MPHVTRPKMPAETAGIGVVPRVSSSLCENNHAEAGFFSGKAPASGGGNRMLAYRFPQAFAGQGNTKIKEGRKQ